MNTPETLTLAQWANKNPEEQKLYREVWQYKRYGRGKKWHTVSNVTWDGITFEEWERRAKADDPNVKTRQQFERISQVEPLSTLKLGDKVIPDYFNSNEQFQFTEVMEKDFVWLEGEITDINNAGAKVHGHWWPLSAISLPRDSDTALTPAPPVETVEQVAQKFEVGDRVITEWFNDTDEYTFIMALDDYIGQEGVITELTDTGATVHGWGWPLEALTPVSSVDQSVVYNGVKYPDLSAAIWDWHSRAMPEDAYNVEAEYAHVAGKSIMFEGDFKEGVAHLQALLSSQQREIEELLEQLKNR